MIRAPFRLAASVIKLPPTTRDSLLARTTSFPAFNAARVGRRPADPTMATTTKSASGREANASKSSKLCPKLVVFGNSVRSLGMVPRWAFETSNSSTIECSLAAWVCAETPTRESLSGCFRRTFRVLSPMDPVAPSRTNFLALLTI